MKRLAFIALVLAVGVAVGPAGCTKPPPPLAKTPPPQVIVAYPTSQEVTDFEDFTGHVEPTKSVQLRAQVTGILKEVRFRDGADVKRDDLLFEIDPVLYQAELDRAQALVVQAEARFNRLTRDYDRANAVVGRGSVTPEELDRIAGDRDEARAAIKVAEAVRNLARQNLEFTRVRAPFDGRLSRRLIDPGNVVKANDTVVSNIVSLDPVYVTFDVDERTVLRLRRLIREGKITSTRDNPVDVKIALADREDFEMTGRIEFADNQVDVGTGTLLVRARVTNPRRPAIGPLANVTHLAREMAGLPQSYLLAAGMFVRIRLPIGLPRESLLVPEEALATDQGQKFLYVLNAQDEVERRQVVFGPQFEQMRAIEKGLTPSDRVIVNGLQRVRPGAKVTPKFEGRGKS